MPYRIDMTQRGALPAVGLVFQHAAIAWCVPGGHNDVPLPNMRALVILPPDASSALPYIAVARWMPPPDSGFFGAWHRDGTGPVSPIAWANLPEIPLMTTGAGPDATQSA